MKIDSLATLFLSHLRELLDAELQVHRALPGLADRARTVVLQENLAAV